MENTFFYCTKCGTKYLEGTKFCSECGKNLNEVVEEKNNIEGNQFQSKGSSKNILIIIGIVIGISIGAAIGYGITPQSSSTNYKPSFKEVITMRSDSYSRFTGEEHYKINPDSNVGEACIKGRIYIFISALICGTCGGFIGAKLARE